MLGFIVAEETISFELCFECKFSVSASPTTVAELVVSSAGSEFIFSCERFLVVDGTSSDACSLTTGGELRGDDVRLLVCSVSDCEASCFTLTSLLSSSDDILPC